MTPEQLRDLADNHQSLIQMSHLPQSLEDSVLPLSAQHMLFFSGRTGGASQGTETSLPKPAVLDDKAPSPVHAGLIHQGTRCVLLRRKGWLRSSSGLTWEEKGEKGIRRPRKAPAQTL